jgi:hypothetical protein
MVTLDVGHRLLKVALIPLILSKNESPHFNDDKRDLIPELFLYSDVIQDT